MVHWLAIFHMAGAFADRVAIGNLREPLVPAQINLAAFRSGQNHPIAQQRQEVFVHAATGPSVGECDGLVGKLKISGS